MSRQTMDYNPLDQLTQPIQKQTETSKSTEKVSRKQNTQPVLDKEELFLKERMTVQISSSTIDRVKDVVYWNRSTIAQFVEEALEVAIKRAEKENGKPFDKRRSELKPGRPTK